VALTFSTKITLTQSTRHINALKERVSLARADYNMTINMWKIYNIHKYENFDLAHWQR